MHIIVIIDQFSDHCSLIANLAGLTPSQYPVHPVHQDLRIYCCRATDRPFLWIMIAMHMNIILSFFMISFCFSWAYSARARSLKVDHFWTPPLSSQFTSEGGWGGGGACINTYVHAQSWLSGCFGLFPATCSYDSGASTIFGQLRCLNSQSYM